MKKLAKPRFSWMPPGSPARISLVNTKTGKIRLELLAALNLHDGVVVWPLIPACIAAVAILYILTSFAPL